MKASNLFVLGAIGIGLYYLWKTSQAVAGGVSAGVNAVSGSIADFWTSLTLSPPMDQQGSVLIGSQQVPLNSLPVGQDASGNVFVQYGGGVYQLGQSDSNGNYPASPVS